MITKEEFVEILNRFEEFDNTIDILEDNGISVVDSRLFDTTGYFFDRLIEAHFNEEGQNIISWYVFEKRSDPSLKMFDEDGNEICKNIDELWDLVSTKYMR